MSTKKLQIIGSLGSNVDIDTTLTQDGHAADAKVTGDAINILRSQIGDLTDVYVQKDEPTDAPDGSVWIALNK